MSDHLAGRRRGVTAGVLLVLGAAVAAATWASGAHGAALGLVAFYLAAAGGAYLVAGGRSDVAAIMRMQGDERQRMVERDAVALSGMAMSLFSLAAAVVQIARSGDAAPYGLVCAVGGIAYAVGLAVPAVGRPR